MQKVYLSLGSNLGDRMSQLNSVVETFQEKYGQVDKSSVYQTAPWGFESKNNFLNMCVSFYTNESANDLLSYCLALEKRFGRVRNAPHGGYASRSIDVDIIYFGNQVIDEFSLQVPHPKLYERLFVLKPLNELSSSFLDPVRKKSVNCLLKECDDETIIHFYCES